MPDDNKPLTAREFKKQLSQLSIDQKRIVWETIQALKARSCRTSSVADYDYRGFGHRLRVTRIALGLTEEQAASTAGRSVETWRKYEQTGKGQCTLPLLQFAGRYAVSLEWLLNGDASRIPASLAKHAQGKVAILPHRAPAR